MPCFGKRFDGVDTVRHPNRDLRRLHRIVAGHDRHSRAVSPARRSLLLVIVGAFSSAGTLAIAPMVQLMLERWDWRVGAALFVVLALAMVPAAFMAGAVDHMPQPVENRAGMGEVVGLALRNRRFVMLCCTHFVCGSQLVFLVPRCLGWVETSSLGQSQIELSGQQVDDGL